MAASNITVLASSAVFIDTALAATVVAVKTSSTVLYALELDNTANVAATYMRFYNNTTATNGTTVPDWIIMVPASVSRSITIPSGITFGTGLCCTAGTSATLATTTAPSSSFIAKMVYV